MKLMISSGICPKGTLFIICFVLTGLGYLVTVEYFLVPSFILFKRYPGVLRCFPTKTALVTAVNSRYYSELQNLIGSIHFWEPMRPIAVYNLGLRKRQLYDLSKMCNVYVYWSDGIPETLPNHINDKRLKAWKPFLIKDAVDIFEKVLWLDSGTDIRRPLDTLDVDLEKDGYFFISPTTDLNDPHPAMFDYFNISRSDFFRKNVCWGNYQGYVKDTVVYERILKPLVKCAADEKCISPPGSSSENSPYDQSALSILVQLSGINIKKHEGVENFLREDFKSNHRIPSGKMFYTGRSNSLHDYRGYIRYSPNCDDKEE